MLTRHDAARPFSTGKRRRSATVRAEQRPSSAARGIAIAAAAGLVLWAGIIWAAVQLFGWLI